ncbi:hypothetical protein [Flavobacterium branchiophilum]|nr:hypothetical protein [Flavobacterium branchiophilum]PDS24593.1 hypothetical protein B0A77_07360 [Flavobacterium branchiophilum]
MLSKEELLETTTIGDGENAFSYSLPRITISNAQESGYNVHNTIKFRNETHNIFLDGSLNAKIEYFTPILEDFFDKHFRKSFEKLINDFDKKGLNLFFRAIKILTDAENREKHSIKFLKEYGFIGQNIETFKQIETNFERRLIPKKGNELINENTINTFFECIKFIKELYINHSYKKLYNTNQILVNTLNSEDNFTSRLKLFHLLYDNRIIAPSSEDAFIECSHCDPGTYKGVFQLRINPSKLKDLKCPVCSKEVTYFVPYQLHKEIYEIVKSKDGLLLDAYCNILESKKYRYKTNQHFLDDIEIDCIFKDSNYTYIVEAKMFKLNTTTNKLKNKIRKHFGKLINDVARLQKLQEFNGLFLKPILLVNVIDTNLIQEIEVELKEKNTELIAQNTRILNLNLIMK